MSQSENVVCTTLASPIMQSALQLPHTQSIEVHQNVVINEKTLKKRKYKRKQKEHVHKMQGYLKAVEYYRRLDFAAQQQILKKFPTPVVVWFINESEYFGGRGSKVQARDVRKKVNALPITIKKRFDHKINSEKSITENRKHSHKYSIEFQKQLQSIETSKKIDKIDKPSIIIPHHTTTTVQQDQHFLSSTLALAYKYTKNHLIGQNAWAYQILEQRILEQQEITYFQSDFDFEIGNIEQDKYIRAQQTNIVYQSKKNKTYRYTTQDLLVQKLKQLPLDSIISILQASLTELPQFPCSESEFNTLPQDPVDYVFHLQDDEYEYLQSLQKSKSKLQTKEQTDDNWQISQSDKDDPPCQVCYGIQSVQGNLIVFCSYCGISLHQKCVGLSVIPQGNWICDLCKDVGASGIYLQCPLCSITGGAMKNTGIGVDTKAFEFKNSAFHEFLQECRATVKRDVQQKVLIYNFYEPQTYPAPQILPLPITIWAHYTCLSWFPSILQVDEERFTKKCQICKLKQGATAKCNQPGCGSWVHAQCAKRKRQINGISEPGDIVAYNYLCRLHSCDLPLMQVQQRKKIYRGDIVKFAKSVESLYNINHSLGGFPYRIYTSFPSKGKSKTKIKAIKNEEFQKQDHQLVQDEQIKIDHGSNEDQQSFRGEHEDDNAYEQDSNQFIEKLMAEIQRVSVNNKKGIILKKKLLSKQSNVWNKVNNEDSPTENYKKYKKIISRNADIKRKIQGIIKKNTKKATPSIFYEKITNTIGVQTLLPKNKIENNAISISQIIEAPIIMKIEQNLQNVQDVAKQNVEDVAKQNVQAKQNALIQIEKQQEIAQIYKQHQQQESIKEQIIINQPPIEMSVKETESKKIDPNDVSNSSKEKAREVIDILKNHSSPRTSRLKNRELSKAKAQESKKPSMQKDSYKKVVQQLIKKENQLQNKKEQIVSSAKKQEEIQHKSPKKQIESQKSNQEVFCICRKPYNKKSKMIQCNDCGEWYDFKCIGFTGSIKDAEGLSFTCMMCLQKKQLPVRKRIMNRMRLLFEEQSAFERILLGEVLKMNENDQLEKIEPKIDEKKEIKNDEQKEPKKEDKVNNKEDEKTEIKKIQPAESKKDEKNYLPAKSIKSLPKENTKQKSKSRPKSIVRCTRQVRRSIRLMESIP